ncbi:hypothetical protein [Streptomyces sp. NPDC006134]|uniref:hypothetical protein n=1 Tax=Streptomyces sp. NPDC006134 TaxID=3154467 RepID=UPI0033C8A550
MIVVPLIAAGIGLIATLMTNSPGDNTTNNCSGSSQCGNNNNRVENGPQPNAS